MNVVSDVYPEATRVRLDVGTGVCVLVQPIGGDAAIPGHHLRIEAVDEPMSDALFVQSRLGRVHLRRTARLSESIHLCDGPDRIPARAQ